MAVKVSKPLSHDATRELLMHLGESDAVLDEIRDEVNNPAVGKHCAVFYLSQSGTFRVVYLSQHLRKE